MSGLFKKLNTLVRASINDTLGDVLPTDSRRRSVDPARLGKNMDREIASLRERINEAIAHEETLRVSVDALYNEITRHDQAADEALKRGDEAAGRHQIEQMQRVQKRLEMAEADLREHQIVTEELIQRVNLLDAVVAEARRQNEQEADVSPVVEQAGEVDSEQKPAGPVQVLSDMLRGAREFVVKAGDAVETETSKAESALADDDPMPNVQAVDDDLAARLKRLSKPD